MQELEAHAWIKNDYDFVWCGKINVNFSCSAHVLGAETKAIQRRVKGSIETSKVKVKSKAK